MRSPRLNHRPRQREPAVSRRRVERLLVVAGAGIAGINLTRREAAG